MKREDLRAIEGLSEEAINKIMALHQNDVGGWNEKFNSQKEAIATKDAKIVEMSSKYAQFEGVDVKKLQDDYSVLLKKYDADMMAKDKRYAKEKLFDAYKWASNMAKAGAMSEFDAKNLEYKDGKFVDAESFFTDLKKSDPHAFDDGNGSTGFEHGGSDGSELSGVEKYFYELNPNLKK